MQYNGEHNSHINHVVKLEEQHPYIISAAALQLVKLV